MAIKPVAPLSIVVKSSRLLLLIQSAAHAVAVGAVLASTLPSRLATILLILIGASLARQRRTPAVAGLLLSGDGRLQTVGADGTANEALVHPHTLVLSFLAVLLYRQEGRLRALTLLADSFSAEDFRQLRLWLRWRSAAAGPA
ncbi:MAG: hypothetical protein M0P95_15300 [Sulfuritalea sp.]|nr:hypothetical protein [Sulfuritalea sp.]